MSKLTKLVVSDVKSDSDFSLSVVDEDGKELSKTKIRSIFPRFAYYNMAKK